MKRVKCYLMISILITLTGCNINKEEIFLSCNGFSEIVIVLGKNIQEKKESSILPVQIKRINTSLFSFFEEPQYEVSVDKIFFKKDDIFSNQNIIIGEIYKDKNKDNKNESRFHLNRNTNHLIFKDLTFQFKTSKQENHQYSTYFEGKCEKVKEKI